MSRAHENQAQGTWPGRHLVAAWFGVFTIYAGAVAAFTGHEDRAWAVFAFGCYALTAILLRFGKSWWPGLTVAIVGALIAPFAWLATQEQDTAEVRVIGRAAGHVLRYGTPYLPTSQLQDWRSYNPYLPVMEVFGLPRSAGLHGIAGDPRVWTSLATLALLVIAFAIMAPHGLRRCANCRGQVTRLTVIAIASPVIAFPLALGITDPPVIALICVALACASRGWVGRASLAVAIACAMKYTAWPVLPVFAVLLWMRYKAKAAAGFVGTTVGTAAILALLAAPDAMAQPGSLVQNTVAFPLGLTHHKTPAASPLPGHLLSQLGPTGHLAAVALMGVAAVAFAAWLLVRPPQTHQSVAWRLTVGYAGMFALAPATRFGYFAYPLCLLGWLVLTNFKPRFPAQRLWLAIPRERPSGRAAGTRAARLWALIAQAPAEVRGQVRDARVAWGRDSAGIHPERHPHPRRRRQQAAGATDSLQDKANAPTPPLPNRANVHRGTLLRANAHALRWGNAANAHSARRRNAANAHSSCWAQRQALGGDAPRQPWLLAGNCGFPGMVTERATVTVR